MLIVINVVPSFVVSDVANGTLFRRKTVPISWIHHHYSHLYCCNYPMSFHLINADIAVDAVSNAGGRHSFV